MAFSYQQLMIQMQHLDHQESVEIGEATQHIRCRYNQLRRHLNERIVEAAKQEGIHRPKDS